VLLKNSLEQIGVICNVKPTEFTVLVDRQQKKQFEAAMGGWGAGTDPYGTENIYGTDQPRNYGSYSNPEVDRLFKEGLRELDPKKRADIYREIHKLMWKDQPYTWLFYRNSFYAFSKKLRGYNFAPTGPYLFDPGMMSVFKPE
jgi:peptide/nickel transport system substrate-binding protein